MAANGETAIEYIKDSCFDLVFLDLKMPGINGVVVLRSIRKLYENLPIYIITAFHREFLDELDSAVRDGIPFQLLRKPIGKTEIQALAQSILSKPEELK